MTRLTARLLPDGRRLHLQDGPIDLIVQAWGPPETVALAYRAARHRAAFILDELCTELKLLRRPARPQDAPLHGPVARRMQRAVAPYAPAMFITPMAAVAGAVAEEVLGAMRAFRPDYSKTVMIRGYNIGFFARPSRDVDWWKMSAGSAAAENRSRVAALARRVRAASWARCG
jgi:ApbE superfamily uncharacterized protein (UPF0280 family)